MDRFKKFTKVLWEIVEKIVPLGIAVGILVYSFLANFSLAEPYILPGILAIVTIIAISNLVISHSTLPTILRKIDLPIASSDTFFQVEEPGKDFISSAKFITICGVTLGSTIKNFEPTIIDRLNNGADIKIIMLDPNSEEVLKQIVHRRWSNIADIRGFNELVNATLKSISYISDVSNKKGSLKVGFLPSLPTCGIIMTDPKDPDGTAIIEFYKHKRPGSTKFLVSKKDSPETFKEFKIEFDEMWKSCRVENY